jgi:hypothetical protein
MNQREAKAMHLLAQIENEYLELTLKERAELSNPDLHKRVMRIGGVLKLFKDEVREDIQRGVVESEINKRFLFTEETTL